MRTSSNPLKERMQEAVEEILSLPRLGECAPSEAIRALTRSHLELTSKSNNGVASLSIEDPYQRERASIIESEYRASATGKRLQEATYFLHSTRIVPGYHLVAPQLCFLAEVFTPRENGSFVWHCHSPLGSFSYSQGPVVTHVQTALHEHADSDMKRHFYQTPLFSPAAFKQDIQRLESCGARLTFGLGPPSYGASLIVKALASSQSFKHSFEPSSIGSLVVTEHNTSRASVRIETSCFGTFTAEVVRDELGVCQAAARRTP